MKVGSKIGSFKVAIIRLRDYLGLVQLFMVSALYFEGREFYWWHYILFLSVPLVWWIDKRFVHPFEMRTIQLRSPVTRKIYETSLKMEKWLDENE